MWNPFKHIDKAIDRIGYWYGGYALLAGSSVMGIITAWVSSYSSWVTQFGVVGWVFSGFLATILVLMSAWIAASVRFLWVKSNVTRQWKEKVDSINPLDHEFTRKRIDINALRDPVTNMVVGKHFSNCDLLGPANLLILRNCHFSHLTFLQCDIVPVKEDVQIVNVIGVADCIFSGGRIAKVTLFVAADAIAMFKKMDVPLVAYTRDELPQPQSQTSTGEETRQ